MLATDWAFLFNDLARIGIASTVQIDRPAKTGRSPRGVAIEQDSPVEDPICCYLTEADDQLLAAGFGSTDESSVLGLLPPGTDITDRDRLTVLDGPYSGREFLVGPVKHPAGEAGHVAALLERAKV